MTSKTIMVGLVALAFVAGSIMTGTMADAAKDPKPDKNAGIIAALTAIADAITGIEPEVTVDPTPVEVTVDNPITINAPQGDKGDAGAKGDDGAKGDKGDAGSSNIRAVVTTTQHPGGCLNGGNTLTTQTFSLNDPSFVIILANEMAAEEERNSRYTMWLTLDGTRVDTSYINTVLEPTSQGDSIHVNYAGSLGPGTHTVTTEVAGAHSTHCWAGFNTGSAGSIFPAGEIRTIIFE